MVTVVSYYKLIELLSSMIRIHKPNYTTITKASFKELGQTFGSAARCTFASDYLHVASRWYVVVRDKCLS